MTGYSGEPPPPSFNMARYCLGPAPHRPADKTALIVVDDTETLEAAEAWTYGALEDAALRIAAGLLAAGLKPGERLLIRLDNTSDYALLFFAALAVGIVPLPASSALSAREVGFLLADSGTRAIALDHALPAGDIPSGVTVFEPADVARLKLSATRASYAPTRADDPAFLIYTSGTTAEPKGVLHAHRSVWGRRPMYQGWYGIGAADRMLHAGAFNWTYTLGTGLSDPWANGATSLVYTGARDATVWPRLMARHRVSMFAGVPSLYRQILKYADVEGEDLSTLRHGLTAGESLPQTVAEEWRTRTGTALYEALGMSELSTYISSSPSVPPKPGAIGKPQAGRCVVILPGEDGTEPLPAGEPGLIAAHRSDPGLMLGYWNRPDEEARVYRGDWFLGGDLGVMDEDGYVTHLGRADDLMNAMGYRVSPMEVEMVLSGHPAVAEVAAAEIEVRPDVHVIGAFVVAREGAAPDAADIQRFAAEQLAGYKVPREIVFLDALPRTANGKVRRAELRRHRGVAKTAKHA